jgi:hypothetical protein
LGGGLLIIDLGLGQVLGDPSESCSEIGNLGNAKDPAFEVSRSLPCRYPPECLYSIRARQGKCIEIK